MDRMRVSGFSFIRNGARLGYPFIESIRSVLPIVDEFVVAAGASDDDTLDRLKALERGEGAGKIRIIESRWNTGTPCGFVYAAQSMAALYNCTGDWALYIQGDEVVHEEDHGAIRAAMEAAERDPGVEGLIFEYLHFYGSPACLASSPQFYRREVRIVRNKGVRIVMPSDAQYFVAIEERRRLRYLRCKPARARMFHYGCCRPQEQYLAKANEAMAYFHAEPNRRSYAQVDARALAPFTGTHPAVMRDWVAGASSNNNFLPDAGYRLSRRDKRQRIKMVIERLLGVDWSKRHFRLV